MSSSNSNKPMRSTSDSRHASDSPSRRLSSPLARSRPSSFAEYKEVEDSGWKVVGGRLVQKEMKTDGYKADKHPDKQPDKNPFTMSSMVTHNSLCTRENAIDQNARRISIQHTNLERQDSFAGNMKHMMHIPQAKAPKPPGSPNVANKAGAPGRDRRMSSSKQS